MRNFIEGALVTLLFVSYTFLIFQLGKIGLMLDLLEQQP